MKNSGAGVATQRVTGGNPAAPSADDLAAILDVLDPKRNQRVEEQRWQKNFDAYAQWSAQARRPPTAFDVDAVGMPGWLAAQTPLTVNRRQLRQLEQLEGFTYGLEGAAANLARELTACGIVVRRPQPALRTVAVPSELAAAIADTTWAAGYLSWLTFCARYKTQPRPTEPGYEWIRRTRLTAPSGLLLEAVNVIGDWDSPQAPSVDFANAAHRSSVWKHQNGRNPAAKASTEKERALGRLRHRLNTSTRKQTMTEQETKLAHGSGLITAATES